MKRSRKSYLLPLRERKTLEIGNGLSESQNKQLGLKIVENDEIKELEAGDKLPPEIRKIINFSPIVKWSSVSILTLWNTHEEKRPDLSYSQRVDDIVSYLEMRNKQAMLKSNQEREIDENILPL